MKRLHHYSFSPSYRFINSTLLFAIFPSFVLLSATGSVSPLPSVSILTASIPNPFTNKTFSAAALFFDNSILVLSSPSLLVCPITFILTVGFSLSTPAISFTTPYDSGFILAEFISNRNSCSGKFAFFNQFMPGIG